MPKLTNVTNDELQALKVKAEDLCGDIAAIQSRLERTVLTEGALKEPVALARLFVTLASNANDMAMKLTHQAAMDEMRRETEAMLRKRMNEKEP